MKLFVNEILKYKATYFSSTTIKDYSSNNNKKKKDQPNKREIRRKSGDSLVGFVLCYLVPHCINKREVLLELDFQLVMLDTRIRLNPASKEDHPSISNF